jgi:hypothetical protein
MELVQVITVNFKGYFKGKLLARKAIIEIAGCENTNARVRIPTTLWSIDKSITEVPAARSECAVSCASAVPESPLNAWKCLSGLTYKSKHFSYCEPADTTHSHLNSVITYRYSVTVQLELISAFIYPGDGTDVFHRNETRPCRRRELGRSQASLSRGSNRCPIAVRTGYHPLQKEVTPLVSSAILL